MTIQPNFEVEPNWKPFFRVAGCAAILIVVMGLVDIIVSMSAGDVTVNSAVAVTDWFEMFRTSPISVLSNLGLINITTLTLGIPIYLVLVYVHRHSNPAFALLSAICYFIGAAVYFSSNTVFSMLDLSSQYAVATDIQKPLIEATGRALLALGADLSAGTFLGFLISQLAALMMGFILLRSQILGRVIPWLAITGFGLMLIFFALSAFVPSQFSLAMAISAPGGLLLLAYNILLARKLIHFSR